MFESNWEYVTTMDFLWFMSVVGHPMFWTIVKPISIQQQGAYLNIYTFDNENNNNIIKCYTK